MHYKNKLFIAKRKAFTLIELLIVIAIIGILFIVLVSKVDFATDKAKATGVQTDFRSFQVAIESVAKENAGLATFGWDTGDTNGDRIRNSYDKGDINQNGKQDPGEVFVGSKTYGETWTNVYTLTNPSDGSDKSAIAALEEAINKNLDPKLHVTINDDLTISMANGAQDPWDTEYHGYYITNAEVDNKDRGAIIIYSNGANQEFGSEHSITNGVVTVNVPGNNVYGKDDYSIAVVYTYVNGYGEVKTQTSGFSQNQEATNNSNNSNNGGNAGDLNDVPVIGDTKQFATLISSSTLKDIYDLSTSPDKEYGQAVIAYNDNIYLCIDYFDDVYDIYYEFYNESEDYCYSFSYATEGIVELGYVPEAGWYAYDDYGDLVKCAAPYITFVQDLIIDMPNGLSDIAPLFVEHKHNYINCECVCGDNIHNYINCKCACGATKHTYINCTCACGDTTNHNYINCKCVVCGDIKHMHDGLCPGLYNAGAIELAADGDIESARDMMKTSWNDLLAAGIVHITNGVVYSNFDSATYNNTSSDALDGDLVLPNDGSVTSIDSWAFYGTSLVSVLIPDSVMNIGNYAFDHCRSLTSINIPDGVTSISSGTFRECRSLASIKIPNGVTSIGNEAFEYCTSLTSVTIPDKVTDIGFEAFMSCWNLTSIIIPDNVTKISSDAFRGCKRLTNINIHNNITRIGNRAFHGTGLTSVTIPDSVAYIGDEAFGYCKSLISITIPDSVIYIGDSAFHSCSRLTSVVIPDSVTRIGKFTFGYCSSLTSIEIPDSVTIIGNSAFNGCTSLTSVTIPDSVTSIGELVFYNCTSLTSVTIPDSVTSIGNSAFYGCTSLTSIVIPDGVTSISEYALYGCYSLTSITIPESVTRIGKYAFYHSTRLATIIFNGSIEQWNSITKDSNWNGGNGIDIIPKVVCSDGTVVPT